MNETTAVNVMKKLFAIILVMTLSLVACGKHPDEPVINDEINTSLKTDLTNIDESEDEIYSNKVYYVGDDIPAGNYAINCTKSEYGMDVVIFASKKDYESFKNAEQFTVGEYRRAVETYAWASFYVKENEFAYIGLKSGNVILLDDGMCEFNKHDTRSSATVYSGIYVVGEDIVAETLNIKCTTNYLQVTVFENSNKYTAYHKADRFTVGEESDAIEKYSSSSDNIYKDDITSVNLKDGMILMIDDGIGEYSVDEGPVIN